MKKIIFTLLLIFVSLLSIPACADEIYDISIEMNIGKNETLVNGVITKIDENENVAPFIENDSTMVPLRFIAEGLGMVVKWEEDTESIILTGGEIEITLIIGKNSAEINGESIRILAPPVIREDRTFVPVRFVSEALQCSVDWNGDEKLVTIRREKETEIDISDEEVQKLFNDILNQKEFASYYVGYCDIPLFDNPENMFVGTARELFSFLRFSDFKENEYTKDEAEKTILDFLSENNSSDAVEDGGMSAFGIESLKKRLERGADYGSGSKEERLIAVYDEEALEKINLDLFGQALPKHENLAYHIGYNTFHLFNRVNLFYPYSEMIVYNVYYNEAGKKYLFTKYSDEILKLQPEENLESETKLVKATVHNGKLSLYIQHQTEFEEYSGGKSTYSGIYKNTYQKGENGYYWISSYGIEKNEKDNT